MLPNTAVVSDFCSYKSSKSLTAKSVLLWSIWLAALFYAVSHSNKTVDGIYCTVQYAVHQYSVPNTVAELNLDKPSLSEETLTVEQYAF